MKRGNFTDNPCFYASVQDAGRTALILGPFATEPECREWAYSDEACGGNKTKRHLLYETACAADPKAHFYSWGMVKVENGYRDGALNSRIEKRFNQSIDAITEKLIRNQSGTVRA